MFFSVPLLKEGHFLRSGSGRRAPGEQAGKSPGQLRAGSGEQRGLPGQPPRGAASLQASDPLVLGTGVPASDGMISWDTPTARLAAGLT